MEIKEIQEENERLTALAEKLIEYKDSFPEYDKDLEMIQNLIIDNLARIQLEQDQFSKKSFTFYR